MTEQTRKRPKLLQLLLIALFLYGSISYSVSLLEYAAFQIRGVPALGAAKPVGTPDYPALIQRCGSQLLPAAGVAPPAVGEPVVLRCGRFWPFYRYAIETRQTRQTLTLAPATHTQVRLINQVTAGLALLIIALAALALYRLVMRRQVTAAYRLSALSFASSLVMVGSYVGLMFWTDPHFGLGW